MSASEASKSRAKHGTKASTDLAVVGICDTMFARADMGFLAEKTIKEYVLKKIEIKRVTVPGIKDLPVACKKLIEEKNCDIVLALGMVGKEEIDQMCAHEASQGLIQAQLMTNTHILGVFIHENEAKNDEQLKEIMHDRTVAHAKNAVDMLLAPQKLRENAGHAKRQGSKDANWFEL